MKRSFQEVVELVVFGLVALLIGTGLLWLGGWLLGLLGLVMKFLAGLIWWLLRYIVPIAIVAGLIYFLVRVLQGDRSAQVAPATAAPSGVGDAGPSPAADAVVSGASDAAEEAPDQAATAGSPDGEPSADDEGPAEGEESSEDDARHN